MRVLIPLLALLLLAACGSPGGDPSGTEEAGSTPTPTPTPDDEVTRPPMEPAGTEIRGVLGGNAQLEGGCAWIDTDDQTRYEVIYPGGYSVEYEPLRLVGPDGQVLAEEGDRLEVLGAVADDMMSTCQVGPLWRADSVELDSSAAG